MAASSREQVDLDGVWAKTACPRLYLLGIPLDKIPGASECEPSEQPWKVCLPLAYTHLHRLCFDQKKKLRSPSSISGLVL